LTPIGDYYRLLQVDPSADQEIVEAAYRRLARKYHPDLNAGDDAGAVMRQLNEAYAVLRDPTRRAAYDRERDKRARAETRRAATSARPEGAPTGCSDGSAAVRAAAGRAGAATTRVAGAAAAAALGPAPRRA
jgi:DnaJ-class molecular chaperone